MNREQIVNLIASERVYDYLDDLEIHLGVADKSDLIRFLESYCPAPEHLFDVAYIFLESRGYSSKAFDRLLKQMRDHEKSVCRLIGAIK